MKHYKSVILLDLDGTISDSERGITKAFQYALEQCGISIDTPSDLRKFIGPTIRKVLKESYNFNDSNAEKVIEKYREYYLEKGIFDTNMYDGIDVMLKELKGLDKTLILATSKPAVQAKQILEYFDIDKYFSFVSGAELDGHRSEKREVIEYAMKMNNIYDVDNCIMVGDRKYDIMGARAVGMESIGVLYGYSSEGELTEAGADYIVESVEELSVLLCKM